MRVAVHRSALLSLAPDGPPPRRWDAAVSNDDGPLESATDAVETDAALACQQAPNRASRALSVGRGLIG